MVKEPRYFSGVDEIREEHKYPGDNRHERGPRVRYDGVTPTGNTSNGNPLGKLPGSVWTIPTEPLRIPEWARKKLDLPDHFAAFPTEWPRRLILGWSPSGICLECGEGRRPVVEKPGLPGRDMNPDRGHRSTRQGGAKEWRERVELPDRLVGYSCSCTPYTDHPASGKKGGTWTKGRTEADGTRYGDHSLKTPVSGWRESHLAGWKAPDTRPAVVLDPFGGTGTVALVATTLGRDAISVDLSHDYSRLARWRIFESGHGRKALGRTMKERQGGLEGVS